MRATTTIASGLAAVSLAAALGAASAAGAAADSGAHAAARPPLVHELIVGRTRVLLGARRVRAGGATVRLGRKRCAVAAATPLAALIAASRSRGGPGFGLRDFGSCSLRPADSAQLFVGRIGSERNRGRDGWVYKVGTRTLSRGAADASGPRLRSGARVLWFWCVSSRRGCQRTLRLLPAHRRVAPGGLLRVTVRGYDDAGRSVRVAGATVLLAHRQAVTRRNGVAVVRAPTRPGMVRLGASRRGLVPAFPEQIRVG